MRIRDFIKKDTRANQPAATAVAVGCLYEVTDEGVIERSNGTTWDYWSPGISSSTVIKLSGQYYSPLVNDGNSGIAKTIDWNTGNEHLLTLTGNCAITLSNPVDGGRYVILLDTGAGGFSVTWPVTVLWPAGIAPTITATASKRDLITMIYAATAAKYYASANQNY